MTLDFEDGDEYFIVELSSGHILYRIRNREVRYQSGPGFLGRIWISSLYSPSQIEEIGRKIEISELVLMDDIK